MEKVKGGFREGVTQEKINRRGKFPNNETNIDKLKYRFPLFKKYELAALQTKEHSLHSASVSTWQSAKREMPTNYTADTEVWDRIVNLSKKDIARLCEAMREDLDPKYLTPTDRQSLIDIGILNRELGQNMSCL